MDLPIGCTIPRAADIETAAKPAAWFDCDRARMSMGVTPWVLPFLVCGLVWMLSRFVFFVGFAGSDDLYYYRFAVLWDRIPANHWEVRLLGNGLIALSVRLLGRNEFAAALPSMAGSLATLICTLWWCCQYGTPRQALWAGLLLALLPMDVEAAGTITAFTPMVGFASVATLSLFRASRAAGREPSQLDARPRGLRRAAPALRDPVHRECVHQSVTHGSAVIAALCAALAVITHWGAVYYFASLFLACLALDCRRFLRPVLLCMAAMVAGFCADIGIFAFVNGDPFLRFKACMAEGQRTIPPLVDGRLNWRFLTWPIENLLYSKDLGCLLILMIPVAFVAMLRGGSTAARGNPSRGWRLSLEARILVCAAAALWLWTSYGSQVPWDYKPFWRVLRFLHPLALGFALVFSEWIVSTRSRRSGPLLGGVILCACLANLLAGGSWGQNARISRELLAYVQAYPQTRFVTDYHTLNELYILNGVRHLPNVATTDPVPPSRLLDPDARRILPERLEPPDRLLINPINLSRTPTFARAVSQRAGEIVWSSGIERRLICTLIPPLRDLPWSLRKPAGSVRSVLPSAEPAAHTVDANR